MVSSSERQPNVHVPVDPPVKFVEDSSGERLLTDPHPVAVMRRPRCGAADAGTPGRVTGEIDDISLFAVEHSSEVPPP